MRSKNQRALSKSASKLMKWTDVNYPKGKRYYVLQICKHTLPHAWHPPLSNRCYNDK